MRLASKLFACGLFLFSTLSVSAAEPVLEFVEGLRERGYYDTALQYLEQVEQLSLAPEVKEVIPYERAQTLLASSQQLADLNEQRKRLDAAQASFEDFVKSSSGHRLAGRANTARGEILMEKARVEIWDGDKPSNQGSRENFRATARRYIQEGRRIFEQAADQHKKAWEAFPTFIPDDQLSERAARDSAETQYMEAQLDLAQCTYWEAQTYDADNEERKKLLEAAATTFEEIHAKYRSQVAGLYARIWQGKCFEERGDIRIALGLYEEILGHEGTSTTMRNLKDRALRFRLICLNHESRKDYQLVADEGEAWVKEAKGRARTGLGLGIQYEMARALELIGTDRTRPEAEQTAALNRSLALGRVINRVSQELKTPSAALIQRVLAALNRDSEDPKDFESAYSAAGLLYEQLVGQKELISKALAENRKKEAADLDKALEGIAGETARLYEMSLQFANAATDERLQSIAQLRLAYSLLLQKRFLDAACVGNFLADKGNQDVPDAIRQGAFIEMTAYDYAYRDAPEDDRKFETELLLAACQRMTERWPEHDNANDARNSIALVYWSQNDLPAAAEWWLKVPEGTGQYVESRIKAGKAYWRQYVLQTSLPEESRPAADQLAAWKAEAIKHIETGLNASEEAIPDEAPLSDDLVSAKLTLASIRNLEGDYAAAIQLLTAEPHPITKAVDISPGEARPTDASKAQSREMASITYQTLLRAYIGKKELEKAREARLKLEEVAGREDAAALTQVFVAFGTELQNELERLRAGNELERLAEVRAGFESFLNDLFNRQDGQTFYSLLWIAETFASLADGSEDNPAKAEEYYDKAAKSYQTIIDKSTTDILFLPDPKQVVATKLLMVKVLRRKRDFPAAEKAMLEVVKELPEYSEVQFEAARLYQDWGASGGADSAAKLKTALYGTPKDVEPKIWGWTYTAQTLQRAMRNSPNLESMHFDARFHLAEAEHELGRTHLDNEESAEHLERARAAITRFLRSSRRWPDEQYVRFNALYRQILTDLNETVVDLPRESGGVVGPDDGGGTGKPPANAVVAADLAEAVAEAPKSNVLLIGLVLLAGTGVVAGLFFFAMKQSNSGRPKYEVAVDGPREAPPVKLGGIQIATSTEPALGNVDIAAKKAPRPAVKKDVTQKDPGQTAPQARPTGQPRPQSGTPRPPVAPGAEGAPAKPRPPVAPGTAGAPVKPRPPAAPGPEGAPAKPRPPVAPGPEGAPAKPRPPVAPGTEGAPAKQRPPVAPGTEGASAKPRPPVAPGASPATGAVPPVKRPRPKPPAENSGDDLVAE